MTMNMYSLVCRGHSQSSHPGEFGIYGAPILYLILQSVLLALFLMFWESGKSLEIFGIRNGKRKEEAFDTEAKLPHDPETAEDASRLCDTNDGLRVSHISKTFGSNLAVDDLTFGVIKSERFALLGPNGAGKSTMISLMRGDLRPTTTHGSILINNDSLAQHPIATKPHLGVYPQFDATDSMTLIEHLRFYARARGVPNAEHNIQELISRLARSTRARAQARKAAIRRNEA